MSTWYLTDIWTTVPSAQPEHPEAMKAPEYIPTERNVTIAITEVNSKCTPKQETANRYYL